MTELQVCMAFMYGILIRVHSRIANNPTLQTTHFSFTHVFFFCVYLWIIIGKLQTEIAFIQRLTWHSQTWWKLSSLFSVHNASILSVIRPVARSRFRTGGCFSGESGHLSVLFVKKVDVLACFLGDSGLFRMLFGKKWTIMGKTSKLWTIWDTCLSYP